MCAASMQAQQIKSMLGGHLFTLDVRVQFDERVIFPLQGMAFGRRALDGHAELVPGQFGLVPDWVGEDKGGPKFGRYCYNARTETVFDKPSFRQAILKRRAVVPVTAFFEFPDKEVPLRRRFKVRRKDGNGFWLAGLWEHNERYQLDSVSILTSEPLPLIAPFHSRSPVLLQDEQVEAWLDPQLQQPEAIQRFFKTAEASSLVLDEEPWGKKDPNLNLFEPER